MPPPDDARNADAASQWRPVLIIALVLSVAMALPVLLLPRTSQLRASRMSSDYEAAARTLQADMPATEEAVGVLTDPAGDPAQFAGLLPALADLDAHAAAAGRMTSSSSLRAWPLAPAAPLDALVPVRESLATSATVSQDLVDDLVGVLNYRSAYAQMLDFEDPPATAPVRFNRFKDRMRDLAASEAQLLETLPQTELLRDHRSRVRRAIDRLDDWVEEYVDALWIGDEATIEALLRELRVTRIRLDTTLLDRLSVIRADATAVLAEVVAALDAALAALGS